MLFPAPAGMNRAAGSAEWRKAAVPRASGDEPYALTGNQETHICSPRQRG